MMKGIRCAGKLALADAFSFMPERLMRFLDLDLDFFLNDNAYYSGSENARLGLNYKPWSVSRVRHFLEERCGLSHDNLVPGRTIEHHDRVIDFWRELIESGKLKTPFEVIHIDAHPDLSVRGGLHVTSGLLHIDSERGVAMLKEKDVHSGNYLTFAIAYGWIASLVWIPLRKTLKDLPKQYIDAVKVKEIKGAGSSMENSSAVERKSGVSIKILPWHKFRTSETFDFMAFSRSPSFTPLESDALIPVVEGYMRQI